MKKTFFLLLIIVSQFMLNSCDKETKADELFNYITFESNTFDAGVELNGSTDFNIDILSSKSTNAERAFIISVDTDLSSADPTSYTVPPVVTIPANSQVGVLTINISDLNISEDGETLVLKFASADDLFTGESITLNVFQKCPSDASNSVKLSITFDDYPEEQSWKLFDSNDLINPIFSGGPYPGESSYSERFCLPSGSYIFEMTDAYGDGGGAYNLILDATTSLHSSNGAYGNGEEIQFTL